MRSENHFHKLKSDSFSWLALHSQVSSMLINATRVFEKIYLKEIFLKWFLSFLWKINRLQINVFAAILLKFILSLKLKGWNREQLTQLRRFFSHNFLHFVIRLSLFIYFVCVGLLAFIQRLIHNCKHYSCLRPTMRWLCRK